MAADFGSVRDELAGRIERAARDSLPVIIRGGGSKSFLAPAASGDELSTLGLRGIVSYAADELVVTAGAGTPLADLEAVLAEQRQMLACEAPHFATTTTLGGMIGAGLAGPRRPWGGSVRDQLLGCELIDGRGRVLRFGGQVMKNVAGYDVTRLMAGACGTLGVVVSASLRLWPLPALEQTRVFAADRQSARQMLLHWGRGALPISATFHVDDTLWIRLAGSDAGVAAAARQVGGEEADAALWRAVRDQRHAFFRLADGESLWRLSVPPAAEWPDRPALRGRRAVEWGGALRWLATQASAAEVHAEARRLQGHARAFRGPATLSDRPETDAAIARVHEAVRRSFDPQRIFRSSGPGAGL